MSDSMMPISEDALHHRTLLFELSKPVILSPAKFEEVWPYVDSVYRTLRGVELKCNGTIRVQKYECRLRKSSKSGTAKVAPDGKIIKRRHSSIRDKDLCHVQIKVSRPVDGSAVTIERFNEHSHSHDIEESFRVKKPSILLGFIKCEAGKNYSAAQIYHAFRGAGTHEGSERLQELGGSSLKRFGIPLYQFIERSLIPEPTINYRQDILNLKRGLHATDVRGLPRGQQFQDDVREARDLLMEKGWLFEELRILDSQKEERWVLVFAQPARLSTLIRRGWFTQFDATHKLNHWGHHMFSFLVRNEYNIWIPTAHLVVERENGEIIAEGLKHIKNWCAGKWQPRYVLTDDSAIEQRAIRLAFPGLTAGEQEVEHLLCSVHSNQTLLRRLGSDAYKPIYQLLKHAMYCLTKIKNRELCDQAVHIASTIDDSGKIAKYVQTFWHQRASKWAMYARQHSPLLLQVTTTNACEA